MKKIVRDRKGFTLIELMIVVAIIGILAAIAIPQLSLYRMRAFNASAESDVRNIKTAEELLMHDAQIYGSSEEATLPGSGGAQGGGTLLNGPKQAAAVDVPGALLGGTDVSGEPRGVGLGLGNGVWFRADTLAGDASFNMYAHHYQGHRVYGSEAETTAILFCENSGWVGQSGLMATTYDATAGMMDLLGKDCGGDAVGVWTPM